VVAANPEAKASPRSPPSIEARQLSRAARVGLPLRAYSYPLWSPGAACVKVELTEMGITVAPLAGSGGWPACMARVLKPVFASGVMMNLGLKFRWPALAAYIGGAEFKPVVQ